MFLAALHLGCPARRSSRSQRNNAPRFYLNPEKNDTFLIPSSNNIQANYVPNNTHNISSSSSFLPPSSSNFLTPSNKVSSPNTCINSDNPAIRTKIFDQLKFPFSQTNTFSLNVMHHRQQQQQHRPLPSSSCSVYPLYYGNQFHFEDTSRARTTTTAAAAPPANSKSNSHLVVDDADGWKSVMKEAGNECDLALRLGPRAVPRISSVHNSCPQEVLDGCLSTGKVGSKSGDMSSQTDRGLLPYLPMSNAHDMLVLSSTRRSSTTQNLGADGALRKRKVNVGHSSEDKQFSWPLKIPFNHFNGSISNAGP